MLLWLLCLSRISLNCSFLSSWASILYLPLQLWKKKWYERLDKDILVRHWVCENCSLPLVLYWSNPQEKDLFLYHVVDNNSWSHLLWNRVDICSQRPRCTLYQQRWTLFHDWERCGLHMVYRGLRECLKPWPDGFLLLHTDCLGALDYGFSPSKTASIWKEKNWRQWGSEEEKERTRVKEEGRGATTFVGSVGEEIWGCC